MFKIEKLSFADNHELVSLINEEQKVKVGIIPSLGGMINHFSLDGFNVIDGIELDLEGVEDYLTAYKSSVLLPYPNRIAGGSFNYGGNPHQLHNNEMALGNALHGFIYNQQFEVVKTESNDERVMVELSIHYPGDAPGFPYPFQTILTYSLDTSGKLMCSCSVKNTGESTMPLGMGWHPYFNMGKKVDELLLQFDSTIEWVVNDKMIPTGEKVSIAPVSGKIGSAQYDGCFTLDNPVVELAVPSGRKLTLDCGSDFPYLQVYTPPHRNSIAIEPMTCPPDVYNNMVNLIELEPGTETSFAFSMILE